MKIKNKKQLVKVADAVRLLHADATWMWVSKIGQVHLSRFKPLEDPTFGWVGINADTVCMSLIDLKIPVADTLVQLNGN